MEQVSIFWHRRDLRYQDNVGLYYALDSEQSVLPIFIFDSNILDNLEDKKDARVSFIYDQLKEIDQVYRNNGSGLRIYHGDPLEIYKEIVSTYDVAAVYTNRDYEPYAKHRDQKVEQYLQSKGVKFYSFKDQVIFEEGEILTDQGQPYKVYTPYKNKWLEKFKKLDMDNYNSDKKLQALWKGSVEPMMSLKSLGFEPSDIEIPSTDVSDQTLEDYGEKRDIPSVNGTSRLGVHLRFGTISIREQVRRGDAKSDVWLSELIWREFYMMILAHYPDVVDKAFKSQYDQIPWMNNEEHFQKWCEGMTGYPIVDAGMRELNTTGYMHNRVRMVVASFLTKHLLIDWRWGERYFAQKLLDFELASNNGGWQWAAGTGTDAQPYFRVFNPYSQQEKFDKDFKYIKKWVPEFGTAKYPDPIVPHKEARQRAIDTYKEALS
ncbi:MAG: deoxyribodipyrimidine photolyase [Flammeovirgaceae bacterium]|nr:deoxyribodipyrimidine photolyase [Flammeovirgaceae bacterium]|tara:strand:- start:2212 stop:3510 length:1299 start_codon:yes stop_codon:yes gene_type:complete